MADELYEAICAELAEDGAGALLADGFEAALVGVVEVSLGSGRRRLALYDLTLCVRVLVESGMDEVEAVEYLEVAVTSAYVGEGTPAYATVYRAPALAEVW